MRPVGFMVSQTLHHEAYRSCDTINAIKFVLLPPPPPPPPPPPINNNVLFLVSYFGAELITEVKILC
jgi:hypothetical protein